MIGALGVNADPPKDPARIVSGREYYLLEELCVHMVRTTKSGENATGPEKLERTQMDFLVATERVWNSRAVPGERRRIEDDEVESRNQFFVGRRDGLRLEPVKYISGLKGTLSGQSVHSGVLLGYGDSLLALVDCMDLGSAGSRGM